MTTEADRIAQRERQALAWSFRDMLMSAADDKNPSAAAMTLLATVQAKAPAAIRRRIEGAGLAVFRTVLPDSERQQLFDALKLASEEMADQIIGGLIDAQQAKNGRRRRLRPFQGINLPLRRQIASTGFLGRFSASTPTRPSAAPIEPTV